MEMGKWNGMNGSNSSRAGEVSQISALDPVTTEALRYVSSSILS